MRLEFHQLERRGEYLRTRRAERERRLLASLAATGQADAEFGSAAGKSAGSLLGNRRPPAHRRRSNWAGTR
jgi:hypothetical protein